MDPFTGNWYAFAGGNPISFIELDGAPVRMSCSDTQVSCSVAWNDYQDPGRRTAEQRMDTGTRQDDRRIRKPRRIVEISAGLA